MTLTIKIDDADYQAIFDSIMQKKGIDGAATDLASVATRFIPRSSMENMIASYINNHQEKLASTLIGKCGIAGLRAEDVHISAIVD